MIRQNGFFLESQAKNFVYLSVSQSPLLASHMGCIAHFHFQAYLKIEIWC